MCALVLASASVQNVAVGPYRGVQQCRMELHVYTRIPHSVIARDVNVKTQNTPSQRQKNERRKKKGAWNLNLKKQVFRSKKQDRSKKQKEAYVILWIDSPSDRQIGTKSRPPWPPAPAPPPLDCASNVVQATRARRRPLPAAARCPPPAARWAVDYALSRPRAVAKNEEGGCQLRSPKCMLPAVAMH
jgi:hypothetical protein